MRLIFDLYPCQTGSRFRGIGRFTFSMAEAMARLRGRHDVYALGNALFPDSLDDLRLKLGPALADGRFSSYAYPDLGQAGDGSAHVGVATALIQHAYQALLPDAVIYTTPFEGWGERGVVPLPGGNAPSALRAAVLYDFIPWLFPERYLDNVPGYRQWYERRLAALSRFDLLLAISEATRQDAIRILGIAPDRVVNISGAAGDMFRPMPASEQARHDTRRFGIVRPFVLYTGNIDYRKNLHGMLEAYARLPQELRRTHQLVLNQVGSDVAAFRQRVRALGLADEEVVITGHITDEELICLYSQCKVFVFPSLYEGFGLPILEAMACGAPVIAANNSSIPEVVGREDVLFDAASPDSTAAALQRVLGNERLRRELAAYSLERAKFFSWDRTARLAWAAIENCHAARHATPAQACLQHLLKPRIAVVCPLSAPDNAGARHCEALLPHLARYFDIDLFIEEGTEVKVPLLRSGFAIRPHTRLPAERDRYAAVVYHVGNGAGYAYTLPLMQQCPGVVVLHDAELHATVLGASQLPGAGATLASDIIFSHGLQGLLRHRRHADGAVPLTTNRRVLQGALHLVATETDLATRLMRDNADAWLPPLTVVPATEPAHHVAPYAAAIHAAIAADDVHTVRRITDALEDAAADNSALAAIAAYAERNMHLRRQPRLLVDVTQLTKTDANSGIQRVVKKIAYQLGHMSADELDRPLDLVRLDGGRLRRADAVIGRIFGLEPQDVPDEEVHIHPGDTLLMIDSSWEQYGEFLPAFQAVRAAGGRIVTVVYDLIPLRLPQLCLPVLVQVFQRWFRLACNESDMLLCISRSVADDARAYLAECGITPPRPLQITHWGLGADLDPGRGETTIRPEVERLAADQRSPLFLMVGTVEPRKGHEFVLDAFERLWQEGSDARLCIAGKEGWHVADTMRRIRRHPQLNDKLFLIESFSDAEINVCYAAATALIAASVAEGFGLPIVEAALHGVPVLASDIPVFREVGGEGAQYFSLAGPQHLADAVKKLCETPPAVRSRMASKIRTLTWRESALQLLEAVQGRGRTELDSLDAKGAEKDLPAPFEAAARTAV